MIRKVCNGRASLKFLIKIEEALDGLILNIIEKTKKATPSFVYDFIHFIKHLPDTISAKAKFYQPKLRILMLKAIGYTEHYTDIFKNFFTSKIKFLKSEEFKKADKFKLALVPILAFKHTPIRAFTTLAITCVFASSMYLIYKNTSHIVSGTKALRKPASAEIDQEPILEFKKIKYEVTLNGATSSTSINLDITLKVSDLEERDKLIPREKELEKIISEITPHVDQLPITKEAQEGIEKLIQTSLLEKAHLANIKEIKIKQVLGGRPTYYLQTEKLISVKDLNIQLFLEDTKRNRQVWIDFTALSNNRYIVLFLKEHEIQVRDHINTYVEPVIPQLPIEEEGRGIIKDKIRSELNEFLKKNGVEGKILDVYIDYIIVS